MVDLTLQHTNHTVLVEGPEISVPSSRYSLPGGEWFLMNSTTIITGLAPLQP